MKALYARWKRLSIRHKILVWMSCVCVLIIALMGLFSAVQRDVLHDFSGIMDDNVLCYELQEAIEAERVGFAAYIREPSRENLERYRQSCAATRAAIDALPFDYTQIGQERYARTWNIRNGYDGYTAYRDAVIAADPQDDAFTGQYYQVLQMQENLATYALRLVQVTMEEGNRAYSVRAEHLEWLPALHVLLALLAAGAMMLVIRILTQKLIRPLLRMASQTHQFRQGDFSAPDIQVDSEDEAGVLVDAFNHMKHAMRRHIKTLEERNRMAAALHQQELAKVELEQHLDRIRLEMLKSQVNPHFLFNTLNMISCMARLEDAATTDRMILSLGNLFRYNLRTTEQEVNLEQEIDALADYVYIQQMRFDSRVSCHNQIRVDAARVRIPSFTLQPVVENAFVHGLSARESDGRITLRVWQRGDAVVVSIADNGRGMTPEALAALKEKLRRSEQTGTGIGLGNICRRIEMMYPDGGAYHIYSKPGRGTVIQFVIPQSKQRSDDHV